MHNIFLRSNDYGQGIMTSGFLPSYGRLNFSFSSSKNPQDLSELTGLNHTEALKFFE